MFVIHVLHLVRDVLEPVLGGFCLRNHVRELSTNDRLRVQWLPECLPLVDPLQALLHDHAHVPRSATAHGPSFVIEVAENDENSSALRAERVLHGHLDVLEGDVGSTRGGRVRGLDRLCLNTLPALNENDSKALVRLAANCEAMSRSSANVPHKRNMHTH